MSADTASTLQGGLQQRGIIARPQRGILRLAGKNRRIRGQIRSSAQSICQIRFTGLPLNWQNPAALYLRVQAQPDTGMTSLPYKPAPCVMIVDDSVANVRFLSHLLQDLGDVVFATNGRDALQLAREKEPDLMLLDDGNAGHGRLKCTA